MSLGPISDQTNTGLYTVDSGVLMQDEFGVTLTLDFTIENDNGIDFDPITTIDFNTGETVTCKADDLRRIPSLVATTTSWDFACDADALPKGKPGPVTVTDDYNDPRS